MFIDKAIITAKAGKGGKGCSSIYRDKYTRFGIPNGGNGGKGADIIIIADRNLHTLLDFQYNRLFQGTNGKHGSSNNKKGKNAQPLVIKVPCGTIIKEIVSGCTLRSLDKDKDQVIVAIGGKGGRGNQNNNEILEPEPGQEKELLLDLKLIADVGVIGFPNSGKSTLISNISNAHPKIASYPFTTKSPVLGVIGHKNKTFVMADIPGLIEGSSSGKGLGDKFLRHVERTKILVHLIDMASIDGRNPIDDFNIINKELRNYSKEIAKKPQVIAANKMDLENANDNLKLFKKAIKKTIYPISALEKTGLEELIEAIRKKL